MSKIKFDTTPVRKGITTKKESVFYYTVGTESINSEGKLFLQLSSLKELILSSDNEVAKKDLATLQGLESKGLVVILNQEDIIFIRENGFLPLNQNRDADTKSVLLEAELAEKDRKLAELEKQLVTLSGKKGGSK